MATASDTDLRVFIDRQYALLDAERDAEIERTSLLISNCSQKLLEQKGLALGGLGVASVAVGLGGKSLIELERPAAYHTTPIFPPHTLRTGDLARIDEHASGVTKKSKVTKDTSAKSVIEGVVYKVSNTRIVLAVDPPSSSNEDLDIPDRCCLIKLANTVTHERMHKAITSLESMFLPSANTRSRPPNTLHRTLLGLSSLSALPQNTSSTPSKFFDPSLNPSQITAVRFAVNSPEVACIHGPPGTGKTRVLVEVIRQLAYRTWMEGLEKDKQEQANVNVNVSNEAEKKMRILVCGASNLAVDNLLERLSVPAPAPAPIPLSSSTAETDTGAEAEATTTTTKDTESKKAAPSLPQPPPIALTRLGHPARIMSSLYSRTLDFQTTTSDEASLAKDVKSELEDLLAALSGSGSGGNKKGASSSKADSAKGGKAGGSAGRGGGVKKGVRLRGEARRAAWANVRELRKEYRKREEGVVRSVLSKAQVVLSTCHGAGSRQIQNIDFDVVIIDEATQAMEAVCWIPILKAKKLILAGDPMQLGPTIISEGNKRHEKSKVGAKEGAKISAPKPKSAPSPPKPSTDIPNPSTADSDVDSDSDASSSGYSTDPDIQDEGDSELPKVSESTSKSTAKPTRSLLRPPKSLNTTLFDRLETMYGRKVKRMLDVQYRMNTKIASFPSKTLYHSRLKSFPANAGHVLADLPSVLSATEDQEESDEDADADALGPGSEVIFFDTAGAEFWERSEGDGSELNAKGKGDNVDGGSLANENEAEVVRVWVGKLIQAGLKPSQISIITPYQAQAQLLRSLLTQTQSEADLTELEIGTADGMQGRENEAVIISLVRSNPDGEVGFLKEKRRLNVAMTRAKRHLCVVGDSSTIRRGGGKYLKKWMDWLENEADLRFAGDLV
ncbi:hypothetical protein M422DRAFT_61944 [Sphaerobolus stellatus SS14]|uniref:DNA helicase n=1 Tax=Sphaerobolus stellatus (strain SS14) TaxID=990650 RepID=A0A0C9TFK6_SPHS4|nr:hypothetical protein M422DRAFT_61944 [Sphaerobolus stellatus SS14]